MRHVTLTVIAACFAVTITTITPAKAENRIDGQRPDAPELAAYGDNKVGVRTIEVTNPGQVNILEIVAAAKEPGDLPTYDRKLTVEVWYPAADDATGENALETVVRDGTTKTTLIGKGMRDAPPRKDLGALPLVIISHGYPGNRFLLAHLGENIASKGYIVASIDHTDSTYSDQVAFGSTLVNRPLDQLFVIDQLDGLSNDPDSFLSGMVNADQSAIIGYSMGGYGAIIAAGGGVTETSIGYSWGAPHGTLGVHKSGSDTHNSLPDPRVKTAIAIGPWGMNTGFWDNETLKGVKIPMMFVAGSVDDVSGYENGVRAIWKGATGVDRALLTFDNANHNAGAPMPAPAESYVFDKERGFNLSEHYTDAVWDNVRMNNVTQHFVTAWLGKHLKDMSDMDGYLDLVANSNESVWAKNEDGTDKPEHNHWKGFPNRTAKGLRFEWLRSGE